MILVKNEIGEDCFYVPLPGTSKSNFDCRAIFFRDPWDWPFMDAANFPAEQYSTLSSIIATW